MNFPAMVTIGVPVAKPSKEVLPPEKWIGSSITSAAEISRSANPPPIAERSVSPNVLMPLGLHFQKELEWKPGLIDDLEVAEIILLCRRSPPA